MKQQSLLLTFVLFIITSCGAGGGGGSALDAGEKINESAPDPVATSAPIPPPVATNTPTPVPTNTPTPVATSTPTPVPTNTPTPVATSTPTPVPTNTPTPVPTNTPTPVPTNTPTPVATSTPTPTPTATPAGTATPTPTPTPILAFDTIDAGVPNNLQSSALINDSGYTQESGYITDSFNLTWGLANLGEFTVDKTPGAGKFTFTRNASDTGRWLDVMLFPNDADLTHKFGDYKKITLNIQSKQLKKGANICSLLLGFGGATGHENAADASTNLILGTRDWMGTGNGSSKDMIRFAYESYGTTEYLGMDIMTNFWGGTADWDNASWTSFTVQAGTKLTNADDYVQYQFSLTFDHTAHTIDICIGIPEGQANYPSNIDTSAWTASHCETWDYQAATNFKVGGQKRYGIDLTDTGLTFADLLNVNTSIGFGSNGYSKECIYSDLKIELQ